MTDQFKDYFSENSAEYSKFRPKYPEELFLYLSSLSKHQLTVWDCATGSGQAAVSLAEYFSTVIATDASKTQILNAEKKSNISYRVATAENSHIADNSIDLITIAQALHWFNMDDFSNEANRVLKDQGIIAVWGYNLFSIRDDIDELINDYYSNVLKAFWPKERIIIESGYKHIQFPFNEIDAPTFHMSAEWNLSQLLGYLSTWSATKQYQKKLGINPVSELQGKMSDIWGAPEKLLSVKWPLSLRLWQKNSPV